MKKEKWKGFVLILACVTLLFSQKEAKAGGEESGIGEGLEEWMLPIF